MLEYLYDGELEAAIFIASDFSLPEDMSQESVQAGMTHWLSSYDGISQALAIKDAFRLPEDAVQKAVKEGFIKHLTSGDISKAQEVVKAFNLADNLVQDAIVQDVFSNTTNMYLDYVKEIGSVFHIPENVMAKIIQNESVSNHAMLPEKYWGNIENFAQALIEFRDEMQTSVRGEFNNEVIEIGKDDAVSPNDIVRMFDKLKEEKYKVM